MNINFKYTEQNPFVAKYDFGPKTEQIPQENRLKTFFFDIITLPFKIVNNPSSSRLGRWLFSPQLIWERFDAICHNFRAEKIKLQTPDGDVINGTYFDARYVQHFVNTLFDVEQRENEIVLKAKDEFYKIPQKIRIEMGDLIYTFTRAKGHSFRSDHLSEMSDYKIQLPLSVLSRPIMPKEGTPHTVLISPAMLGSHQAYVDLTLIFLFQGINVMGIDHRGILGGTGTPTAPKDNLDLEAAYQYLVAEKGVKNEDILVYGYCGGGGPATDLAARRAGVNLFLDRSIVQYRQQVADFPIINYKVLIDKVCNKIDRIKQTIECVLKRQIDAKPLHDFVFKCLNENPLIRIQTRIWSIFFPSRLTHDITKKLPAVTGHVAVAVAENDQNIIESQRQMLLDSLPEPKGKTVWRIFSQGEHSGLWYKNERGAVVQLEDFLQRIHFRKRVF